MTHWLSARCGSKVNSTFIWCGGWCRCHTHTHTNTYITK